MSKKNKKHNFVHADPESEKVIIKTSKPKKNGPKENKIIKTYSGNIFHDLKKSVITILIFIIVLVIFYLVDSQFNLLDQIKTIFN